MSAPADQFSAQRAFLHVQQIADEPHPAGSEANAQVRQYLMGQLQELGLNPTVQRTTTARDVQVARVENIQARIAGRATTGQVILVAHYDSVPQGPGAADDGAGVAAILEIVRALTAGPALRNDVDVVLTDAEESGLLGAHAFVAANVADPGRSVVLNLEARGTSGPSFMFETSSGNADLIRALAGADPPAASSESELAYRLLPNDTDLTEFRRVGFAGMNFAFADGSASYHTPQDSPANLELSSLQHQGGTVLMLTRVLGEKDLGALDSERVTYFTVLGRLVWYSQDLAVPLALLAVAAFVTALWYARRHGARLLAVAGAAASLLAPLILTGVLASAVWRALTLLRPGYASFSTRATYRPEWYEGGLIALAVAVTFAWYLVLRRRCSTEEVALGVWTWLGVLGVTTAFLAPEAAHLFAWPLLAGGTALALTVRFARTSGGWGQIACCAAAFPAVVLLLPLVDVSSGGLDSAAVPLIVLVLVTSMALPLLDLLVARRAYLVPVTAMLVGLVLLAVGLRVDVFDARHPRQTSLVYALDADRRRVFWLSSDLAPAPWTAQYVGKEIADAQSPFPAGRTLGFPSRYRIGPASVAPVSAPGVVITQSRQDGDIRVVRLRITPEGASRLTLNADTTDHAVAGAVVDGLTLDGRGSRPTTTRPWGWGFVFTAVPSEGIDVTLTVRGEGPLPLEVVAYHNDLPRVPELTPRPDDLTWSPYQFNSTVVVRTTRL